MRPDSETHSEVQEQEWCKRKIGFEQDVVLQEKTIWQDRRRFALLAMMKALSISVCFMKYSG